MDPPRCTLDPIVMPAEFLSCFDRQRGLPGPPIPERIACLESLSRMFKVNRAALVAPAPTPTSLTGRRGAQSRGRKSAEAFARAAMDRGRRPHGGMGFHWHAQLACRAIRALPAGFAEAEDASPKLDHRFSHCRAAAPCAFDRHFPTLDLLPAPILSDASNKSRTMFNQSPTLSCMAPGVGTTSNPRSHAVARPQRDTEGQSSRHRTVSWKLEEKRPHHNAAKRSLGKNGLVLGFPALRTLPNRDPLPKAPFPTRFTEQPSDGARISCCHRDHED
jgi:hypothetical protein